MIYIFLNILVLLGFIYLTHVGERNQRSGTSFSISLLLCCIEVALLIVVLLFKSVWAEVLTTQVMRLLFIVDGILFVMLTFSFVSIALDTNGFIPKLIQFALIVFVFVIAFGRFSLIEVTFENGIIIKSEYLFPPQARQFFPWTWVTVYTVLYRYILPLVGLLLMSIKNEDKNTQLEKNQTFLVFAGLAFMWFSSFVIRFISNAIPSFSLLYLYSYLFMYVVIISAYQRISVPSGKAIFLSVIKVIISYFVPAGILGFVCMWLQPMYNNFSTGYVVIVSIVIALCVLYSFTISDILSSSAKFYTADYESTLERDLASIDYATGEMDSIASRMYDIIKRNTEASSMNVYISNNQNEVETAYTSTGLNLKITVNTSAFETLLNNNRTVILLDQIDKEHVFSDIREELEELFAKTKSDALFILNEGHNIFGLITLGPKSRREHFKEYDYKVFEKFYSYFFVFGYYMRNISNKEVIGVVNREIKMSSQIITSIQENLDHVKNEKMDTGYMMVPAHNIGGEFIDMIRLTNTRHLYVVGDLSGKGIAASMNMVILKSIIRTYLAETHDFKELVVKINTFVRDSLKKGTIFAGLFALVDFETDTMYYINCGIPALMMYTQVYNNVIEIQGSGHVLGFVKDIAPYISVKTTKLSSGDIILACTDGLVQSHSLRGEQFGKERIQQAILDNSTYNAQRMTQFTFDSLIKFMSKEMEDDVSILVLKYGAKEDEPVAETPAEAPVEDTAETVVEEAVIPPESEAAEQVEETVNETPAEDSAFDLPDTITQDAVEVPSDSVVENDFDGLENSFVEENSFPVTDSLPDSISEGAVPLPEEPDFPDDIKTEPEVQNEPAAEGQSDFDIPSDPDLPDLSDLDAMLKDAGL